MKKGDLISLASPVRFFDETGNSCIILGLALVLESNEWDVTCLVDREVLWTNWLELGDCGEKVEYVT